MLSYRHAFHAGNFADVLKHAVLGYILSYYQSKQKPWHYLDSHAGAGLYRLQSATSEKTKEYLAGIARLWSRTDLPPLLENYVALVKQFNVKNQLEFYPGSPALAFQIMKTGNPLNRLFLFELHPRDAQLLNDNFQLNQRQVKIQQQDGLKGIKALLPPLTRRAVILIDPAYEQRTEYEQILATLEQSIKRFAQGCFVLWYPILAKLENKSFHKKLKQLTPNSWLNVELYVSTKDHVMGMYGTGLYVVNPPWMLLEQLQQSMPMLTSLLAQDQQADYQLDYRIA